MFNQNPNKVTERLDQYDMPTGVSVTPFEQACDAYASAIVAAAYPSDTRARFVCMKACAGIDVDYIKAVALTMEKLGQDFDHARFSVAEMLGDVVRGYLHSAAKPREGLLSNGKQADARGFALEDDYGSLA